MRFLVTLLTIIGLAHSLRAGEEPELLRDLTDKGVLITNEQTFVVPGPMLSVEQSPAVRKETLDEFAGGRGWKSFSRKSAVAPIAIDVNYIKNKDGDRIGHSAHSAFIVHASLETLKNEELMKQVFGSGDDSEETERFQIDSLPAEELASMGITLAGDHESYGEFQMSLLSRVIVSGVVRTQQMVRDDTVTIAWMMDPRFTTTKPPRNTWVAITRNDVGKKSEGPPQPYRGAAGYLRVSRLPEVPGASFVESHLVLHEPSDWFRGSSVLRSKLPILMQESARNFRRKLMEK